MSMVLAGLLLFGVAAEPPPSPPVWQVDHGENFCSVIHRPRADPGQTIVYRLVPLSSTADLLYSRVNGDKGVEPPQTVRVLIEGATADTVGDRQQIPFPAEPGLSFTGIRLARSDVDRALAGSRLSLVSRDVSVLSVDPPRGVRLRAAVETCEERLVASWGFDPALPPAVPINPERFLSFTNYPMRALRAGRGGATQFLATVEPAGTVSSCRLLVGSGDAQLDETTCSVMQRRARFEPFEGARRPYVGTVVWMIGD